MEALHLGSGGDHPTSRLRLEWPRRHDAPPARAGEGRFWNYEERGGMRVPLESEVAWLLPKGEKPYWRGHTTGIDHEFVP
jgi:hypothetical protein